MVVFSSFFEITIEQFYHLSYCLIFGVHFWYTILLSVRSQHQARHCLWRYF